MTFSGNHSPWFCSIDFKLMTLTYLWVALGGALGSVMRFWISVVARDRWGEAFPWGTIVINIAGSFIIGMMAALVLPESRLSANARSFATHFVMIGICGGFTTFSAFSLQTINLLRDRQWFYAGGNVLLSVVLCVVATWLGLLVGSAFNVAKNN